MRAKDCQIYLENYQKVSNTLLNFPKLFYTLFSPLKLSLTISNSSKLEKDTSIISKYLPYAFPRSQSKFRRALRNLQLTDWGR